MLPNDLRDIPILEPARLTDQAADRKWAAGMFDFGKAKVEGVDYFNCSLATRPDGDWLVTRRCSQREGLPMGFNDLVSFRLDGKKPAMGVRMKPAAVNTDEHLEDPRAFFLDGHTWLSACSFLVNPRDKKWTGAHQVLFQVGEDWRAVNRYDVAYGLNGDGLAKNSGLEKNWLWFFHEGQPHLIYLSEPHTVVQFDAKFQQQQEYIVPCPLGWPYGEVRGGTPPVLVGKQYWSFFHSSLPWTAKKRRYFMGAYSFEAKPPFRPLSITTRPLLIGSWRDRWVQGCPLVVFPNGSVLREDTWLVVGGVNDLDSFWCEIPHSTLLGLMERTGA